MSAKLVATTPSSRSPGVITRRPLARHGLDIGGECLYVGERALVLTDVASYKASGLSTKDLSTAFATIAIFSGVAAFFVFSVDELGWRTRFLFEGALFGAIAVCAVAELFSSRRSTLFTFDIVCKNGDTLRFVTAETADAHRIRDALNAAIAQ